MSSYFRDSIIPGVILLVLVAAGLTDGAPAENATSGDISDGPSIEILPPTEINETAATASARINNECWQNEPSKNVKVVNDFFDKVLEQRRTDLVNYLFDENVFIQHSGIFGRQAFKDQLDQSFQDGSQIKVAVKSFTSESGAVWAHVHTRYHNSQYQQFSYVQGEVWFFDFNCYGFVSLVSNHYTGYSY